MRDCLSSSIVKKLVCKQNSGDNIHRKKESPTNSGRASKQ